MRIGVIGGGAAGLVAAINAKSKANEVMILERNSECGKKILATGNGKCNYWNSDNSLSHYESSTPNFMGQLINPNTEQLVMNFFSSIGIVPRIKNGYYYPKSNQAITIRDILVDEAITHGVIIKYNYLVTKIQNKNGIFIINDDLIFDKLIIASGSKAAPKTGSDGMGYNFLKRMGHTIVEPLPALVQLNTKKYAYLNKWKGIRCEVKVSLIENEIVKKEEFGEIQLTEYGISGICVFNISNEVGRGLYKNKKEIVKIDFLPDMDNNQLIAYLNKEIPLRRLLSCFLNNKLVNVILDELHITGINKFKNINNKDQLINKIKAFQLEIESTRTFNEAQVSSGGVSLVEIDLKSMESKLVDNLYIVGELLDITGECGGYNLGIAWRSGILAGISARSGFDD